LQARDFLIEAGVWPTLKRSLRNQVMEIQTDPFSFLFTSALKPEKIPIKIKVIVVGDAEIYDLLHWYDEDFRKIFKMKADFDLTMPNNPVNMGKLAGSSLMPQRTNFFRAINPESRPLLGSPFDGQGEKRRSRPGLSTLQIFFVRRI
jgi:hypothetical protein